MAACGPTAATSIKFTVRRRPAVLVAPASPTPRELKRLSDVDDHLRIQAPVIYFYQRRKESMSSMDPAAVIRDAVARALVPYYPFAGRLRKHDDRGKLAVDCTAEGVLFVEADADVRLEQFGDTDALLPPFPCVDELLFDVPGSSAMLDAPLLLFQVTRLACGGFVMGVRLNHIMADAHGLTQFLGAVAELARGDVQAPTVPPVWERHLLEEGRRRRNFPLNDEVTDDSGGGSGSGSMLPLLSLDNNMALRYLFFGPDEIAAMRAELSSSSPELEKRASRFDVIAGWLWKYRTMALAPDSNQPMQMVVVVNARGRTGLPAGYYGNAVALPAAESAAGDLCANPVSYAVALVKQAKAKVDMEFVRSVAEPIDIRGRIDPASFYSLTDETRAGFDNLDFGWGKPVYGGPTGAVVTPGLPGISSFILPFKNTDGEDGAVVPVSLPPPAMDRLVDEMGKLRRRRRSPADVATVQQPRRQEINSLRRVSNPRMLHTVSRLGFAATRRGASFSTMLGLQGSAPTQQGNSTRRARPPLPPSHPLISPPPSPLPWPVHPPTQRGKQQASCSASAANVASAHLAARRICSGRLWPSAAAAASAPVVYFLCSRASGSMSFTRS